MYDHARLLRGETLVNLFFLDDDVTGVSGEIFISAPPENVWRAVTNYDNLHRTLPKVLESRVIERSDREIILDQTGRTGILIFEKTVKFRLKIVEHYPGTIAFEQISGDFLVYHGEWRLESVPNHEGTLLHYHAEIKPRFFAPPILVNFVQRQDLPGILNAHKRHAEADASC
ncbi:cyclase [Prosthecochloris sp. GSB1]|uniref:SRPBCC family protein n=1 Tax=Prosthecochloris sp. GSB1 TaxID=281093 RepID=UPI000B8C8AF0|nr:SRPBCC family protein [Prosthecochloris sp. GSB1]ASQ90038.1 cyclase [Prosthecochloris sp. GSB1]